jgi:phosphatidylglycerophosphatase A
MPGTWGTLAAIPLVMLSHRGGALGQLLIVVLFLVAAVHLADRAELLLERRDAGFIVIDEMSGFLVSFLWLPLCLPLFVAGFVFFRLFDIVKPYPIGLLENRLQGGWGIVMDDVVAGIYTNICLQILVRFLWQP